MNLEIEENKMLYKTLPYFLKELDQKTRIVTGIFAVHGNVDSGGDMSVNGSFAKRLSDGRSRVRFLWNHNSMNPPIASVKSVREVEREELPPKVLEWAPDASGGVEVTRKYYDDIPLSDWVFKGIQEGDITEMSYAYDVHEFTIKERDNGQDPIRILNDVELYDVSDVNWGMNPATAGVKGLPVAGTTFVQHSALVESTIEEYLERVKDRKSFRENEGRTLSDLTRGRLAKMVSEIESILRETQPFADVKDVLNEMAKFEFMKARL
jgi:HK97 family phage prohead protease